MVLELAASNQINNAWHGIERSFSPVSVAIIIGIALVIAVVVYLMGRR